MNTNNEMKLYHYTSIKSLAAILSSKKIRFTRLDLVDDPEEYCYTKDGIDYAKYVYVSCFTDNCHENIPQWQMYADNKHGVRIEVDSNLFDIVTDKNHKYACFPQKYYIDKEYMIMPLLENKILYEIQYVEDVSKAIDENVYKVKPEGKGIDFKVTGIYKNTDWAFLHEYRYILHVFPKQLGKISYAQYHLMNHCYPKIEHIDLPIKLSAYNSMNIMIGPKVDSSEECIISSLMHKYLGREDYKESSFRNK